MTKSPEELLDLIFRLASHHTSRTSAWELDDDLVTIMTLIEDWKDSKPNMGFNEPT